jgi:hypothetical protein
MARIVVGSYVACYPVGGFLSWTLQWLLGFQRLGHDVYLVEKCGSWPDPCFDPPSGRMGEDCSVGINAVGALLERFDLRDRFCFVDRGRSYHGMSRERVESLFKSADLFVDISGGLFLPLEDTWLPEAEACRRVCVDGEPGYSQMRMQARLVEGASLPAYDLHYTVGWNVGTARSSSPTVGRSWRHVFDPVNVDLYSPTAPPRDAPFSTIMAWQSHKAIVFNGRTYGQKDVEFAKFKDLPRLTRTPLEIAVHGRDIPLDDLRQLGWIVRGSHSATASFDAFTNYIQQSRGEFAVCKHVFVETQSGWFSDRSAVYLANARPVVMQDTGFGAHLPCGAGLFAVQSAGEAAAAIEEINSDYTRHAAAALNIAREYLDAPKVLRTFLDQIGIGG